MHSQLPATFGDPTVQKHTYRLDFAGKADYGRLEVMLCTLTLPVMRARYLLGSSDCLGVGGVYRGGTAGDRDEPYVRRRLGDPIDRSGRAGGLHDSDAPQPGEAQVGAHAPLGQAATWIGLSEGAQRRRDVRDGGEHGAMRRIGIYQRHGHRSATADRQRPRRTGVRTTHP
jgi:hypothetical protein